MASTDARPIPRKNTAYRVYLPILDADGDLVTGATGLDSEVSIDGGTFADCTNEATEIATSSGMYYLDLTSSEMNGDAICVIVKTSSSGAKTTPIVLYPQEAGDIQVNVTYWNGTAVPSEHTAGYPIVTVKDGTGTGEIDTTSGGVLVAAYASGQTPLQPTVAGRTLDVTATGAAGIDWANVENPTTANNLSATNIDVDQVVASVSGAVGSVTGSVGSVEAGGIAAIQSGLATGAALTTAQGDITSILADTNELQTDWADGGRLDLLLDGCATPAQVNAEVVDALATDTYAEPGQGTPAATLSLAAKVNYLFKAWRNKKTQTSSTFSLFADDATTVDQKATVSDDGTTTTVGEVTTGP